MDGLSTSNEDDVVSIDTTSAYKKPMMVNPKRVNLDYENEEEVDHLK